jgi:Bacterial Ig-like domain (group 2)/Divergent InlB B-repeat domain
VTSQWFRIPIRGEQGVKKLTRAFFLVVALVLMAGLGLVSAGPAVACDEFTLTIATDGNGWTDPSGTDSYEYGEQVWVDAYENDCYTFDRWSGDVAEGHEYDNPVLIPMSNSKSITAHFVKDFYTLSVSRDGCCSVKLDGDTIILPVEGPYTEDFDCGDVVTLTAGNGEPCQFQYWSIGHEVNQELVYAKLYDKEITLTMDADYYAVLYCSPSPEPSPEPTPTPTPAAPTPTPTPGVSPNSVYVPATFVSLEVRPGNATIQVGASTQFRASAKYSDSTQIDVTTQASWDSAKASIATVSSGLAKGLTEGTTNITATLQGKSDDAVLSVTTPPPSVLSVEVQPGNATILVGGTHKFTATAHYSDSTSADVTAMASWISSQLGVATVASGLTTGVTAGVTNVVATYSGALSNPAILTVTAPKPTVLSVEVKPGNATITVGATQQFTATAHYSDSTSADVTNIASWDSSVVGVATMASGLATGVTAGVTDIVATYSGVLSNPAALTVTPPKPTVQTIVVEPGNATVSIGGTQQFTATAYYSNGTSEEATNQVTWESSDKSVVTIDNTGLATGVDVGNAQITASLEGVSSNPVLVSVVPVSVPWAMIGGIIAAALALGLFLFFLLRRRRRGVAEEEE